MSSAKLDASAVVLALGEADTEPAIMSPNRLAPSPPEQPELSIIIPAYNAASTLPRCLDSVLSQISPNTEVIVVDDGSTDSTAAIAAKYPVHVIAIAVNGGSGPARNRGAAVARGSLLLFLDADVTLREGALARVNWLASQPDVVAVIGSYDDEPAVRCTVSLFKNLAHHYFHQRSAPEVSTFWSGCGAIKRTAFVLLGGFDEGIPEIGDVDLGYRLSAQGLRLRLDPNLQVKHLKHWTLGSLVRTDFNLRALPWARMLVTYGYLPKGLNFTADQRAGALVAILSVITGVAVLFTRSAAIPFVGCLVLAAALNLGLLRLFWRKGGMRLVVGGFLLQQFYYLYSVLGLGVGIALTLMKKNSTRAWTGGLRSQ
jgi:glycosyltransferase involved in cell wall biosynthesis